ncbi:MAG: rhodanese-like domain-containing protein [Nitrospirota bacterium]|jgi:rhodanese-related sulfurtransferase
MGVLDYFKPVNEVSPEGVRKLIAGSDPEGYNLVDVRQPGEYAEGHLPGAELIPLSELQARQGELDHDKRTIVYCRAGRRSRAAAGMLAGMGFRDVAHMEGGILAYNGLTASGGPESGMFCFPDSLGPGELAAVAWLLEENTIYFLKGVKGMVVDSGGILDQLGKVKEEHKKTLAALYREVTGKEPGGDFPKGVIEAPPEAVMVGCVRVRSAIEWARDKKPPDVLELMLTLEANALDLYLKLGRMVKDGEARKVFRKLADHQQRSVERASEFFEKALA